MPDFAVSPSEENSYIQRSQDKQYRLTYNNSLIDVLELEWCYLSLIHLCLKYVTVGSIQPSWKILEIFNYKYRLNF